MIAIAVLLVVILATSQIFGTASQVTGTGHALASVLQEAAVIEKRLRQDFSRITPEGFLVIRQVAVPNDINLTQTGRLLNPSLPAEAMIRADQLVFFADGVAETSTFAMTGGTATRGKGAAERIYYGHGFQLAEGSPFDHPDPNVFDGFAHDPQQDVYPWHAAPVPMLRTRFASINVAGPGTNIYQRSMPTQFPETIPGTQPEARRWVVVRQAVSLLDSTSADVLPNNNSKTIFMGATRIARSIFREPTPFAAHPWFGWSHEVRNGRMDGAASTLDEIRRWITTDPFNNNQPRTWAQQLDIISGQAIYYPRAERVAPSPHRVDQALTNHVIGSAVSSFIVEWTYEDGTGDWYDNEGNLLCYQDGNINNVQRCADFASAGTAHHPFGFYTNAGNAAFLPAHPWFGLNRSEPASDYGQANACPACPDRGVGLYGDVNAGGYQQRANYKFADTVWADNIEWWGNGGQHFGNTDIRVYEAIFGYNRNRPVAPNPNNDFVVEPHQELAYTPWPSAVRITMVLHDPQGRLEHGREFQFVIDLPKRVRQ